MKEQIKRLIQNIIYIMMGLQILLGILWMGESLSGMSRFEESTELLHMSETLCMDEYTGILYPPLIRLMNICGNLFQLPGYSFLYVLQLTAALFSYGYFLKKIVFSETEMNLRLKGKIVLFAFFVMTVPPIAQCHVAILPYSFASSAMVVLLAETIKLWKKEYSLTNMDILRIAVSWGLSAMILPDYAWLGGVAVVLSVLRYIILHKKLVVKLLAMCLTTSLVICGFNVAFQTEGSMGRIQRSAEAVMLQRVVWPHFATFQYFWCDEVKELWDEASLKSLAMYPETVIYEFGPKLEAAHGKEYANVIYWEMIKRVYSLNTKEILLRIMEDIVAYICPPLTMLLQLQGMGVSYTGWNYGRMTDYAPGLTMYYVKFSLYAWTFMLMLSAVLKLFSLREKGTEKGERIGGYLCVVSVAVNLWYVIFSGNMQDYKKLMVNSILWAFLIVKVLRNITKQIGE